MLFFIDFENVGCAGLVGIESLTENDCVRIYYSNDPNVDMHSVQRIVHSKAKKQFIKLPDPIKMMNLANALDIVILTDISRMASQLSSDHTVSNYAIVVSNDKGYDPVISELNNTNHINNIVRVNSIASFPVPVPANKGTASAVVDYSALDRSFTQTLSKYKQYKDKIVKIVKSSKTRCEINNRVNQSFDNVQSRAIMEALKPLIKGLPGQ